MDVHTTFLKIPLHKLYYIHDIEQFSGLSKKEIDAMRNEYDESELLQISESVSWAVENKDYDFSSLLPNLSQSNEEIYTYLCKLQSSLKEM